MIQQVGKIPYDHMTGSELTNQGVRTGTGINKESRLIRGFFHKQGIQPDLYSNCAFIETLLWIYIGLSNKPVNLISCVNYPYTWASQLSEYNTSHRQ